uniref:Uncharacterized protein n=1 Tax=Rhizophora mucronata TaxID=61149 RepID=A0A2P2NZH3_RHIMU
MKLQIPKKGNHTNLEFFKSNFSLHFLLLQLHMSLNWNIAAI